MVTSIRDHLSVRVSDMKACEVAFNAGLVSRTCHCLASVNPGDLIYFPDRYWHATINLDPYTAFVSTFTQEHQVDLSDEL